MPKSYKEATQRPYPHSPMLDKDLMQRLGIGQGSRYAENGFEFLTEPLYDTEWIESGVTTELRFFNKVKEHHGLSNMYMPGSLPDPVAFLITGIRLFGVTSAAHFGVFTLEIGNKLYGDWPTWSLGIRERRYEFYPIVIPTMMHFRARVAWQTPPILGNGLDGKPKRFEPLQVFLRGYRARPIC